MAIEQIQAAKGNKPIPLTREMFEAAFRKCPPSISEETLKFYENFTKTR